MTSDQLTIYEERQGVGTTEKKMQLLVGRVQDLNQLLNPAP